MALKNVRVRIHGPNPGTFGITTRAPLHGVVTGPNEFTFEIYPENMNEAFLFVAANGYKPINDLRLEMGKEYDITMEPNTNPPDPEPIPIDEERWKGNFLALPEYPKAFMYPAWDSVKQESFRKFYRQQGYTHLPFSPFAKYGDEVYDFRNNPQGFINLCKELKVSGILPIVVSITNEIPSGTWPLDKALEYLDNMSDMFKELTKVTSQFIGGWEMSDVMFEGSEQLTYYTRLREVLGNGPRIWYHDRPNWWGPHYPPYTEWDWWNHTTGILDGIAMQVPPGDSIAVIRETIYDYPWNGVPTGIVGRVVDHLHKRFQMFEHSRDMQHYKDVLELIRGDVRVEGYC